MTSSPAYLGDSEVMKKNIFVNMAPDLRIVGLSSTSYDKAILKLSFKLLNDIS